MPVAFRIPYETATAIPFLSVFRHTTSTPASLVNPSPQPIETILASPQIPVQTESPIIAPVSTPNPIPDFYLCSPIDTVTLRDLPKIVSDPYTAPPPGSDQRHEGVDFSYWRWKGGGPILGVAVQSVLAGKVAAALSDTFPYGNFVIIETRIEYLPASMADALELKSGMSLYLLYAHLDKSPVVSLGENVKACQTIGAVGKSGNAMVPHLHFEARTGPPGARFLGMSRFVDSATKLERENYLLWRISGTYNHFDPMTVLTFPVP